MDKTIAKSNSKARVLAASNGVSGIRIDIRVVNVPELLKLKAEEALRALIPELPEDISYPIDPDLIPEGKGIEVSDLLIDYLTMSEFSIRVEKGGPGCGNGQCVINGKLLCCDPPPPENLMATMNDSTFIERHAYTVPSFFKLTFLDNSGNDIDFIIKSVKEKPHLSYYRVLDEELIEHINIEVKDAFVLNP